MKKSLIIEYIFLGVFGSIAFYFSEPKILIPFITLSLIGLIFLIKNSKLNK